MDNVLPEHEILALFRQHAVPLNAKLKEMFEEHHVHQTERRGCGYTQATRVIAEYVNTPRSATSLDDLKLFENYDCKHLKTILNSETLNNLDIKNWRNLDLIPQITAIVEEDPESHLSTALLKEFDFQKSLRSLESLATLEESQLICHLIEDIILPKNAEELQMATINTLNERPKVGSCPMAEKFFLKVAHHQLSRQGIINIFVDENNEPVMMEKLNMGDDHSCISLKPLIMNGVRLPAGSLFATEYEQIEGTPNKVYKGNIVPLDQGKFWFLRVTTLAISPKNRARAFTTHYKQQILNGLLNPETTELSQIIDVAKQQV